MKSSGKRYRFSCQASHKRREYWLFLLFSNKQSGSRYTAADIRLLTAIADELSISLQNALRFEEIKQFNITLTQKIEAATLQLRHANQRLKALDETKDDFISMASHQLRTPLSIIKGYIDMVITEMPVKSAISRKVSFPKP